MDCQGCGESLTEWRMLNSNGVRLRQRGLSLARSEDFVGACVAFLEAGLTNPLDDQSLVDVGRCLLHLNRLEDGMRILKHADSRSSKSGAKAVLAALKTLLKENKGEENSKPDEEAGTETAELDSPGEEASGESSEKSPVFLRLDALIPDGGWKKKKPDSFWLTVLQTERNGTKHLSSMQDWLQTVSRDSEAHSGISYLLGLHHWNVGDRQAAYAEFERCLRKHPPVLNPVAWLILLGATGEGVSQQLLRSAADIYNRKSVLRVIDEVAQRLQETGGPKDALKALKSIKL